jgi:hypothetical protein
MGFLRRILREQFVEKKPAELKADIMMISGCEDVQTSADVSNVATFKLPDSAGRAGSACTSALLHVLYKDHAKLDEDLSFTEVLQRIERSCSLKIRANSSGTNLLLYGMQRSFPFLFLFTSLAHVHDTCPSVVVSTAHGFSCD